MAQKTAANQSNLRVMSYSRGISCPKIDRHPNGRMRLARQNSQPHRISNPLRVPFRGQVKRSSHRSAPPAKAAHTNFAWPPCGTTVPVREWNRAKPRKTSASGRRDWPAVHRTSVHECRVSTSKHAVAIAPTPRRPHRYQPRLGSTISPRFPASRPPGPRASFASAPTAPKKTCWNAASFPAMSTTASRTTSSPTAPNTVSPHSPSSAPPPANPQSFTLPAPPAGKLSTIN